MTKLKYKMKDVLLVKLTNSIHLFAGVYSVSVRVASNFPSLLSNKIKREDIAKLKLINPGLPSYVDAGENHCRYIKMPR